MAQQCVAAFGGSTVPDRIPEESSEGMIRLQLGAPAGSGRTLEI